MSGTGRAVLSKEERVRRTLASAEVDRPPYSFWSHFPGIDLDPEALAKHTVRFAAELDLDFVKAMSNGLYCVEDWGVVADYSAIGQGGVARVVSTPIAEAADWRSIGRLAVTAPALGRELRHLSGVAGALGRATPLLATVFSPLTIAHKLAGAALERDIRQAPDLVLGALEKIALTTADFTRAALAAGCAGVFFAVQDADPNRFDDATYAEFGEKFDRIVLDAAAPAWFNVIHMHGDSILFDRLKDYPVTALNWHIGEAPQAVGAYRGAGGRMPIVGGLRRDALTRCDIAAVQADLDSLYAATAGRGILISPGCVIRHPVDMAFLKTVVGLIVG
ncbi:MAG: uroporphyrinogen decarboxylase family protein [Rhodopila sp.]|nr:uroporphyrinogen decarboxylase family protein [Rhodopila sp.]